MFYRFQLMKCLYIYDGNLCLGHELVALSGTCEAHCELIVKLFFLFVWSITYFTAKHTYYRTVFKLCQNKRVTQ